MGKRCLYLLHTDWRWIKQRSQFLAENLAKSGNSVLVCYKFSPRRKNLVRNATAIDLIGLPFAPFGWRALRFIKIIDVVFWRTFFYLLQMIKKFDCVIVTHPLLFEYTRTVDVPVIYDLHDDNEEFYSESRLKELIRTVNQVALRDADVVVFSSAHLHAKYSPHVRGKSQVVRNAHSLKPRIMSRVRNASSKNYHIVYFGSISSWFDAESLLKAVREIENLDFTLIGPIDCAVPSHPRLKFTGAMPHADMLELAQTADALIMPFSITPLIEGVDPVKLYEYLAFPVPVFSVYYDELDHFRDYLTHYFGPDDLIRKIRDAIASRHDIDEETLSRRLTFLKDSTWQQRVEVLNHVLDDAVGVK